MRERFATILDRGHHSNTERVHMWQAGMELWRAHPLLGIGPGNVKVATVSYLTPQESILGGWGHLHSIYVNFLAERGALGLAAFLLFMAAVVWELWKAMMRALPDPWTFAIYKGSLLSILGFLIGGITETSYNTAVVKMMFYFVVGLALALARHET